MGSIATATRPRPRTPTVGTIVSTYDGDRMVSQTWYNPDGTVANNLAWTYDDNGNVLTASSNAGTYTMTYDGNQLKTVTSPTGLTLTYSYDDNGNVISIADSQGGLTTMTYDGGRVMTKTYQDANTQLRVNYTYDDNGNVLTESQYSDLAGTNLVGTTQYTYDGNRMTGLVQTDASGNVLASYSYSYNTAGQLSLERRKTASRPTTAITPPVN